MSNDEELDGYIAAHIDAEPAALCLAEDMPADGLMYNTSCRPLRIGMV